MLRLRTVTPSIRTRPCSTSALTVDRDRSATSDTALSTRTPSSEAGTVTVRTRHDGRGPADQGDQQQDAAHHDARRRPR